MARDEDDVFPAAPKAKDQHVIGQVLDQLSIAELDERISILKSEISRLESVREKKEVSKRAADSVFKSS